MTQTSWRFISKSIFNTLDVVFNNFIETIHICHMSHHRWKCVAVPNQVVGGRVSLLNKGNFCHFGAWLLVFVPIHCVTKGAPHSRGLLCNLSRGWFFIWPVVSVLESLQLLLGFCGTLTLNILVSDLQHGLQSSASVFGIFLQLLSTAVYLQQFFPQHCGHGFSRITV